MMKESSSFGCEMYEAPGIVNNVCSDQVSPSDELVIAQTPHKCCEVKLASILGTDEYLLNQIGSTIRSVQVDLIPFTFQQDEYAADFSSRSFSDSSPPTETSLKLFLSNHNFRI